MAVPVANFDVFTNEFFVKKLKDNFFLKSPFLMKMRAQQKTFEGGNQIKLPVSYKKSPNTAAWRGRMATIATDYVQHATDAVFDLAMYVASLTIPETDQWLNAGDAKVVDLLKAQTEMVEESLVDTLATDFFGTGVNNSAGAKTIDGLQALMTRNADGSEGAYGDISRASSNSTKASWTDNGTDNSWWNANVFAANASASINFWKGAQTIGNTTTLSIAKIQQLYGICSDGASKPNLFITGQLVFDAYSALVQNLNRQTNETSVGAAGFQTLEYSSVPFVVDDLINAPGTLYALNLNELDLRVLKAADFAATEWRSPANQQAKIKFINFIANLTTQKARAHGATTGFTG